MKNLIIILLIVMNAVSLWAFGYYYNKQCQETVDWAIQDTSDATLSACEGRIDEILGQF